MTVGRAALDDVSGAADALARPTFERVGCLSTFDDVVLRKGSTLTTSHERRLRVVISSRPEHGFGTTRRNETNGRLA